MSAVPYPRRETGKGKVFCKKNSNCLHSGTLVPQAISQACVLVEGEWSFSRCVRMLKGIQLAPPGNRDAKSITHPWGFILVLRVCIPRPVLQ